MNNNDPIGIFDSGLGGLSVVAQLRKQLPHEHLIFFGDSARNPYGTRTRQEVADFSLEIARHLAGRNVKAIVIACNTATSAAANQLRSTFDFDIIGMEPALKLAAEMKTPSRIAVWATALTLAQEKFSRLKNRFSQGHEIIPVACPRLVELVESDQLDNTDLVDQVLLDYLDQSGKAEFIVLGCTHFVFFKQRLEKLASSGVTIIDGNAGTARQVQRLLEQKGLLNPGRQPGTLVIENSLPEKQEQSWKLIQRLEEMKRE